MTSPIITVVFVQADIPHTSTGVDDVASNPTLTVIVVERMHIATAIFGGTTLPALAAVAPAGRTSTLTAQASPHFQHQPRFSPATVAVVSAVVGAIAMFMALAFS
ncbi:hypothetical protein F5878DRAFT_667797 [Lentinula raphanica]|uniref:Uncharacterized protein n=1 Tax=Lentinula raphanica TaxID=153919 RepID=A0AA38U2R9_9AGAR|nr:hypothetical protein F5878DRAFT_667797 [Lentinula raphanica]